MKDELIKKITDLIDYKKNTILSEWSCLDDTGGYLIRKDGEIVSIGKTECQDLPTGTYSHLNKLTEVELDKIYTSLINKENQPKFSYMYLTPNDKLCSWALNNYHNGIFKAYKRDNNNI